MKNSKSFYKSCSGFKKVNLTVGKALSFLYTEDHKDDADFNRVLVKIRVNPVSAIMENVSSSQVNLVKHNSNIE